MRGFEEQRAPRWLKVVLNLGALVLFSAGLIIRMLFEEAVLGVLLMAFGAILFAVRGYLRMGDKVVTGAVVFVALVVLGITIIVHFLGP